MLKIERKNPRKGVTEEPYHSGKGYKLADPKNGTKKHHTCHATFVDSLDEAVDLVSKGYSLWMTAKGKRASLISPQSLRITR